MTAPRVTLHRVVRFMRRAASIAFLFVVSLAGARQTHADNRLSVLSYNVHGLPSLGAADHPRDRVAAIGSLASMYDVALFQEDFEYHGAIRRQMEGSVGAYGNGMAFDVRRMAAKILLAPVSFFIQGFSPPYGAGLSTFVKTPLARPGDVGRQPFRICDGWLGSHLDCWASKGYLRVGIRTPDGAVVDVYTTHLDAGRGSVKARRRQLRMLASAIEAQSGGRAVIVGGDFNLASDRPGDGEVMVEFRERLNLRDSGAGPELPFWRNRDYILYRSGTQAHVRVEQAGEALEFVEEGRALSDHPAVYARFRVGATQPTATDDPGECLPFAPRPREQDTVVQ